MALPQEGTIGKVLRLDVGFSKMGKGLPCQECKNTAVPASTLWGTMNLSPPSFQAFSHLDNDLEAEPFFPG